MAQDLDISQFFRRAPKEWLQRYFAARGALGDFDWGSVSVRKIDALSAAFASLDKSTRGTIIEDFYNVKLLATPAGKLQIIDEAPYHGVEYEVARKLNELDDTFACAFYVLLEHPECWEGAVFYATADAKSKRYWKKRIGMPALGRKPTDDDGQTLAEAVKMIFRQNEGRGDHCEVRQYRRGAKGEREYFFVYSEDHKQTPVQFQDGKMAKRPYNPAFEIIFILNDSERSLTIWHHGASNRIKDLQQAFAKAVLKQHIEWDSPRDERVYDLERLKAPSFKFVPAPELGIAKVEIRRIGLRILGSEPHLVTIDLGQKTESHVLDRRIEAVTAGLRPSICRVARVGCRVTFEKGPQDARARTRSFELVWPNSSSIQNDPHGLLIQRMLSDHGIELQQPSDDDNQGA